jgi:plasmid stabilization system protein ParE
MVVKWSDIALKHIAEIYKLYFEKSEVAAEKIFNAIFKEGDKLGNFPEMAQKEQLLAKKKIIYRSLVVQRNFKIVYSVYKNYIHIVDVWDCRQNPKNLKNRIKD